MSDLSERGSDLKEQSKTLDQSGNEAKLLCNACGIKSRKKKRAVFGVNMGQDKKGKRSIRSSSSSSSGSSNSGGSSSSKIGDNLKQRLWTLGREVMRRWSTVKKQRRKLGEEEQAAVLLIALSCGSVYA